MSKQWQNRIVEYGTAAPADLLANPRNVRTHPKQQADALAGVLEDIGMVQDVIVNRRTNFLIDGHLRVSLAQRDGQTSIPVKYVDVSEQEEGLILATFDPISALAGVDAAKLEALLHDVATGDAAVQQLLDDLATGAGIVPDVATGDGGDEFDTTPDDGPTRCQVGDLWIIGGVHRLLVGDCTDAANVARLMDGARADMLFTDPPYGIKRDKGFGGFGGFGGVGTPIARRQYTDDWDGDRPTQETFNLILSIAPICIIWGGNYFADMLPQGKHWVVWDKNNTMPTFGDCELAWTNVKRQSVKKYELTYNGLIGKEAERYHPTQKPVKLIEMTLNDYTEDNQRIIDPFLGSGTTLIAAHRTGRRCYGMEIAPRYGDVILKRAEAEGLTTELQSPNEGQTP